MRAASWIALAALTAATAVTAGCFVREADDDTSAGAVVSGKAGGVKSMVYLGVGCSATKVGPKHFVTAAQCVAFKPGLGAGSPLRIWSSASVAVADGGAGDGGAKVGDAGAKPGDAGAKPSDAGAGDAARDAGKAVAAGDAGAGDAGAGDAGAALPPARGDLVEVTIAKLTVHPSFLAKCTGTTCAAGHAAASDSPDVAMIEIDRETPDVPVTPVDLDAVGDGDAVTVAGYGCEKIGEAGAPTARAKDTKIVPAKVVNHEGSEYKTQPQLVSRLAAAYAVTPGAGWRAEEPGLCGADMGGPLLRAGATPALVGIHANYTQFAAGGLPVTDHHTRVDGTSRFKIGAWLAGLGAATVKSCSTTEDGCPKHGYDGGVPVIVPDGGATADGGADSGAVEAPDAAVEDPGTSGDPGVGDESSGETSGDPESESDPSATTTKKSAKSTSSGCSAAPAGGGAGLGFGLVAVVLGLAMARRRR